MNRTVRTIVWGALPVALASIACDRAREGEQSVSTTRQAVQGPAIVKDAKKAGLPEIGEEVTIANTGGMKQFRQRGSAVMLTNEWVLTAAHVVSFGPDRPGLAPAQQEADRARPGPRNTIRPGVVRLDGISHRFNAKSVIVHPSWAKAESVDDSIDMALIHVEPFEIDGKLDGFSRPMFAGTRTELKTRMVTACGYPTGLVTPDWQLRCFDGSVSLNDPYLITGQLADPPSTLVLGATLLNSSPAIYLEGDSGGGVFDAAPLDPENPGIDLLGLNRIGIRILDVATHHDMEPVTGFREFVEAIMDIPNGETLIALGQELDSLLPDWPDHTLPEPAGTPTNAVWVTQRVLRDSGGNQFFETVHPDGTSSRIGIPAGFLIKDASFTTRNQALLLGEDGTLALWKYDNVADITAFATGTDFAKTTLDDIDQDGAHDVIATRSTGESNVYFSSHENGMVDDRDVTAVAVAYGDFDNDGALDKAWITDPISCPPPATTLCMMIHYEQTTGVSDSFSFGAARQTNHPISLAAGNFWPTDGDELVLNIQDGLTYFTTEPGDSVPINRSPPRYRVPTGFTEGVLETERGVWTPYDRLRVRARGTSPVDSPFSQSFNFKGTDAGLELESATPEGFPTDYIVILDRSGSMSALDFTPTDGNRVAIAALGAGALADLLRIGGGLGTGYRVGVVQYNHGAQQLLPLTNIAEVDSLQGPFKDALDAFVANGPRGATSIGAGIRLAITMFDDGDTTIPHERRLLVLTDGRQNTSPCISDGVNSGSCTPSGRPGSLIQNTDPDLAGVKVCSLGMGRTSTAVDLPILDAFSTQHVDATATGFTATGAGFSKCAAELGNLGEALDPQGTLLRHQVAALPSRYPSSADERLAFLGLWSAPVDNLGDVRLLVHRPNGDLVVPDAGARALTTSHDVQREDAPMPGDWRLQVVRATNRFVNGFTTDSPVDTSQGVGLVRRQIQRLCPDGCGKVLYFEDGRVVPSNRSIYADGIQAELATGLLQSVQSFDQSSGAAFASALAVDDYDLLVYAHQMAPPGTVESYDAALGTVLCTTTKRAIVTDMRAAAPSENFPTVFHLCSGARPAGAGLGVNYDEVGVRDGTLIDENIQLRNAGYEFHSYSVAGQPEWNFGGAAVVGTGQTEGDHERFFIQTVGTVPLFFGSVVGYSADGPAQGLAEEFRSRHQQRWSSEVHFLGAARLQATVAPTTQGGGMTLQVSTSDLMAPTGFTSATVAAHVESPTIDLTTAMEQFGCDGPTPVEGDPVPGSGRSLSPDAIPTAITTHVLNDAGVQGDAVAGDRTWTLTVPALGARQGTYRVRYFADLTFVDAQGVTRTAHRETMRSQYVGPDVLGGGASCPSACDADTQPPSITAPPAVTVTTCEQPSLGTPVASDDCGSVTVGNDAPAVFPLGTTTVTWFAEDAAGNLGTATQLVTTQAGGTACCPGNANHADGLTAGGAHTCAVLGSAGDLFCWGANLNGQLGDGTILPHTPPARVPSITGVKSASAGNAHTCAVVANGDVYCWGAGLHGQLGNGSILDRWSPRRVTGMPSPATRVSAGTQHSCAVLTNGQVWCWGRNLDGRLGNGTFFSSLVPVRTLGLTTAVEVGAGEAHSCARLQNGQVWCWGAGLSGRLGNGSLLNRLTPVLVNTITNAKQITVGGKHTCAALTTGNAVCWGFGLFGALGNGGFVDSAIPVPVNAALPPGGTVRIEAGADFTCAVGPAGAVYCWGANLGGQLGDGTILGRLTPVRASGISGVFTVTGGGSHTCASGLDGGIRCWGSNITGQLGIPIGGGVAAPVDLCE